MSAFSQKKLELTVTLGTGTFGDQVGNTVTLSGLRMFADVSSPCGESMGAVHVRVYGLTKSMMNQLTVIGPINQLKPKNRIILKAGDSSLMSMIFKGTIFSAWADYTAAPEVVFNVVAYAGIDLAVKPTDASSYVNSASVAEIMRTLAEKSDLSFINVGISTRLSNPYYSGTLRQQIIACARDAQINHKIEFDTLTIWRKGFSISTDVPIVSPETGLVGYPALSSQGLTVKTLFNPNIVLGGQVEVRSSLSMASGLFNVFNYVHNLSSEVPSGGPWFTSIDCYPLETT